jgi:hypothetical protein
VTAISLMYGSPGEGMSPRSAKRFGEFHDPVNFVYHYPGYAPVKVTSHDPLLENFVILLADRAWEVKLKVDASTFKLVLADMVAQQNDHLGYRQKAMHLAREHGDAIVRACSEFCEMNLLTSLPTLSH